MGMNTPVIIKIPFIQITAQNPNAVYACLNYGEVFAPDEIAKQSILIYGDIYDILSEIKGGIILVPELAPDNKQLT